MTQTQAILTGPWDEPAPTAVLVLADGTVLEGFGLGATGQAVGEVCFNTAMTGYEEILTDPSYAGQIITFTFPHIGNVGTNDEDIETVNMAASTGARGVILHSAITAPSNYRAQRNLGRMAAGARHRGAGRHRHARADRADPRKGHAQRRDRARARRQVRPRRAEERGQGLAGSGRHGPGAHGHQRPALQLGRDALGVERGLRPAGQAGIQRRRHRLRHQAQHSAPARRFWLQGDGGAGHHLGRGHPGAQARRHVPVERPGRSGGDRRIRGAGDQEARRFRHAHLRHLSWPPDAGASRSAARRRRCTRAITAPIIR